MTDLPTTALATETHRYLDETHPPVVRNHSLRSFLFATALAGDAEYDVERVFLICALHDVGLTDAADGGQRFEVDGADRAAEFLEERGADDATVDAVWDGIALHSSPSLLTSPVHARRRGPEIRIAQAGIAFDVYGSPAGLPDGYAAEVTGRYPRLGCGRELTGLIIGQADRDPRKAPPFSFAGELWRQRHPEAPELTWDALIGSAGWAD